VLEQALTQHGVLQPGRVKTSAALIIMRVAVVVELMQEQLVAQAVRAAAVRAVQA
jgi:hypothetical protein